MTQPRQRVRSSGMGGSGYVFPPPAGSDLKFKLATNADGEKIPARLGEDGKAIVHPGVTTILRQANKPALDQWRADSVAAKAVASIDELLNRSQEEGYNYLRWAADEKLNDAAEQGTNMHEWMAADLGYGFYPEVESLAMEQMIGAWESFKFEHDIHVHGNEVTVWNPEHKHAGTYDFLWNIDDMPWQLNDVKTARSTWPDHKMQLAALANCTVQFREDANGWHEDQIDPSIYKSHSLLHIRPDDYDTKGNFIPAFCNLIVIPEEDMPRYYRRFLGFNAAAYAEYEQGVVDKLRAKAA